MVNPGGDSVPYSGLRARAAEVSQAPIPLEETFCRSGLTPLRGLGIVPVNYFVPGVREENRWLQ